MNVGDFKKWLIENEVADEVELCYNDPDIGFGYHYLDSPFLSYNEVGIATPNPRTESVVVFH